MQLIRQEKSRCEIAGCGERGEYVIDLDRLGIRSKIYICPRCLVRLYSLIGEALVPRSFETIKRRD